jgi:hypothetical protein
LLNLFGNQTKELENLKKWPADSTMATSFQMVLEWLGYEVDYINVVNLMPPETLDPKYYGIVLDRLLEIPSAGMPGKSPTAMSSGMQQISRLSERRRVRAWSACRS